MSTIGNTFLDIVDLMKASQDGKSIAPVIELLARQCPLLEDAVSQECNMGTKHRYSMRTGLPSVTWGQLYKGIPQSKDIRQQVEDATGFVEALSSIDRRILDLKPNLANAYRGSAAGGFMQAMNHEQETTFFYGDTATTPEKYKGLFARYNTLANDQVIDGGGEGNDNTSIAIVTWGVGFTTMIRPEGIPAGIQREDKGEQRVNDSNGDPYYVMEELFRWHNGCAVEDYRYNVRVANIDVSDMKAGSTDLYDLLDDAYWRLQSTIRRVGGTAAGQPDVEPMRQVIYCNRDVMQWLGKLARNAANSGGSDNYIRLAPTEIEGRMVLGFRDLPIRMTDSILNTEEAVS